MKFTIYGRLPGLNEYTTACRSNRYAGAKMKAQAEDLIGRHIEEQMVEAIPGPVTINFNWIDPNSRRDLDNICFAKKFILDSLVYHKIIDSDARKTVQGFTDRFGIDKNNPRIEITIERIKDE